MSGLAVRASTATNTPSSTAPPASGPTTCASPQPSTPPWLRPKTIAPIDTANSAAPGRSRPPPGCARPGRSGVKRNVMTAAVTAKGTLRANTSRQSIEASRPPRTGPSAAKKADPPARIPRAVPLRSRGKTDDTIATEVGIISAAAQPCTTRAPIIHGMSWARPAMAVAIPKTTAPTRKTGRSPSRSPMRPPRTMKAASGRMLAVRIHCDSPSVPPRSSTARGVASGTAVWSTRIMLAEIVMAASVSHIARVGGAVSWASAAMRAGA